MAVRVEKDTVVYVPATESGSEKPEDIELREGDREGAVTLHGGRYGSEVAIQDLRDGLDQIEAEQNR